MISEQEQEKQTIQHLIERIQAGKETAKSDVTQLYFLLFNKREMAELIKVANTIPKSVLAKVMLLAMQVGDNNFLARLKDAHDGTVTYSDEAVVVEEFDEEDYLYFK